MDIGLEPALDDTPPEPPCAQDLMHPAQTIVVSGVQVSIHAAIKRLLDFEHSGERVHLECALGYLKGL